MSKALSSLGRAIALDANLMLTVNVRRLLCSMQEMTGGSVLITQRVWHEAWLKCADTNMRSAKRAEMRAKGMAASGWLADDVERVLNVADKNTAGWRKWMHAEIKRGDSAWRYVDSPENAERLQLAVLSSEALKDGPKKADDALVVAEAMLSGAHILASRDIGSIFHDILNSWAASMKAKGHPLFRQVPDTFIMTPDAAAHRVYKDAGGGSLGDSCLRWAVAACRPNARIHRDALDASIRMFLQKTHEHMPLVASATLSHLNDMQSMNPKWHEVVNSYPLARRTRATEDRRLAASSVSP